jgi:Protein of unknown function (DUF992)
MFFQKLFIAAALTGALLAALPMAQAEAQARLEVGQLVCRGGGGVGLIIGSRKSFACNFRPVGGGDQRYSATITNIGLDLGITGNTTLVWTVLASSNRLGRGELAGTYSGAGTDASIGVGGGANLLVGGSRRSIALQPLSGQVQTGVNFAAGIKGLRLRTR